MTVILDGQHYVMERIKIEDLEEWCEQHNLEADGRGHLDEDGDDWPPIVIFRYREET